jgi:hypothetical protein
LANFKIVGQGFGQLQDSWRNLWSTSRWWTANVWTCTLNIIWLEHCIISDLCEQWIDPILCLSIVHRSTWLCFTLTVIASTLTSFWQHYLLGISFFSGFCITTTLYRFVDQMGFGYRSLVVDCMAAISRRYHSLIILKFIANQLVLFESSWHHLLHCTHL